MPIYKTSKPTKDGRMYFFKVQYRDSLNNLKVFISKKYATKTEAKDEERKYLNKLQETNKAPEKMTIGELWTKFLEYQDDKVRVSTKVGYHSTEKYIKPLFNIKCVDLNPEHYENWKKLINSNDKLCIVSKNDKLKVLVTLLNFGMRHYDFSFNKVKIHITKFQDPNQIRHDHDIYTPEQFNQFLSGEDSLQFRCLWETLYYNGLRIGEARGLTWNDIDFENKTMSINKQIQSIDNYTANFFVCDLKTKSSYRNLPICETLLNDLKSFYDQISQYRNFTNDFYCFGQFSGLFPLSCEKARRRKRKIANATGVKEIRLHDFRHSCASLLINSGAPVTLVSKYLGHASVTETLNTYSHMFKSDLYNISTLIDKKIKDAQL